jgi:hypothetical protein
MGISQTELSEFMDWIAMDIRLEPGGAETLRENPKEPRAE